MVHRLAREAERGKQLEREGKFFHRQHVGLEAQRDCVRALLDKRMLQIAGKAMLAALVGNALVRERAAPQPPAVRE